MRFHLDEDHRGPFRVWRWPDPERTYVIGVDTSQGKLSGDRCACCVLDAYSGDHVATWAGYIEPTEFGDVCCAIGKLYSGSKGQAYAVVETNNHGLVTLERMRSNGYSNFYMRTSWDAVEQKMSGSIGFVTSVSTRPMLIARGKDAMALGDILMPDPELFSEASTFVHVITRDGTVSRQDHLPHCHDDILFAWMLANVGVARLREGGVKRLEPSNVAQADRDHVERWEKIREGRRKLTRRHVDDGLDDEAFDEDLMVAEDEHGAWGVEFLG